MDIGVQDGIIDPKHEAQMGTAVFLYLWCIRCQTQRHGGIFVLGGKPLTYDEIALRSKFPARKVRRWLDRLRKFGYVKVTYLNYMMMKIEVTKAKKWGRKKDGFSFESPSPQTVKGSQLPLTANGQGLIPETVKGSPQNGQPKQRCSMRYIKPNTKPTTAPLPDFVPEKEWDAYQEMRLKIRKPMTPHAVELAYRKLAELQAQGHSPGAVLDQSVLNSWQGLFALRGERNNAQQETAAERRTRRSNEVAEKFLRRFQQGNE
jgi:hypothetical protein